MRAAPLSCASVDPVDDELTELLAELLVRAWRRRHPDPLENVAARSGEPPR